MVDRNTGDSESRHAAEASECANEQGKFWAYHDTLFAHQGSEASGAFSDSNLKAFAATLGLDTARFNACFDAHRYANTVKQDEALANSLGINGVPTVLVNGTAVTNLFDTAALKQTIEAALAKTK